LRNTDSKALPELGWACYDRNDAWLTDSDRRKLKLIAELLCIKHHYFISLDLFNADEVDVAIVYFLGSMHFIFLFLFFFFIVFLLCTVLRTSR